ncbi:hypothetical protein GCM10010121_098320 [Streptomyces brasiliensis]|uniref:Uncharacterized protein n=1 Tax=Streptomyces brasiliensis TaxID=1954 RepID=A0A917UPG0_9ACTN|nr:hypothetical protein GCM10010121_098320 [Streptomyces brasiliensis]
MDRSRLDGLASSITGRGQVEREPVFRELRELGLSPIEAIYVASRVLGLSLPEAKTAIYASTAWRDQQEDWQRLQSGLEE